MRPASLHILAIAVPSDGDEVVEQLPKILNVGIQHLAGLLSSSLVNRVTGLRWWKMWWKRVKSLVLLVTLCCDVWRGNMVDPSKYLLTGLHFRAKKVHVQEL